MSTAAERIQEWAELANNATAGPWTHDPDDVEDAVFIAASRTAVPAMAAALTAVLALHDARQLYELDPLNGTWVYDETGELIEFGKLCRECSDDDDSDEYEQGSYVEWPCATVEAITAALGVTA